MEELNKSSPGPKGENNNFLELVESNTDNGRKTNVQLQNNSEATGELNVLDSSIREVCSFT